MPLLRNRPQARPPRTLDECDAMLVECTKAWHEALAAVRVRDDVPNRADVTAAEMVMDELLGHRSRLQLEALIDP